MTTPTEKEKLELAKAMAVGFGTSPDDEEDLQNYMPCVAHLHSLGYRRKEAGEGKIDERVGGRDIAAAASAIIAFSDAQLQVVTRRDPSMIRDVAAAYVSSHADFILAPREEP